MYIIKRIVCCTVEQFLKQNYWH